LSVSSDTLMRSVCLLGGPLTVSYLYDQISPGADPYMTARELVLLAGPGDPWLLPEDDVTDLCAIRVAVDGSRPVRLTVTERVAAARRILTSGGNIRNVCRRLSLPEDTEYKWYQLSTLTGES
jgi:hypothetical protein